jgi:hypothetical protein
MKLSKNKYFRANTEYYFRMIVFAFAITGSMFLFFWLLSTNEEDLVDIFGQQESSGNSSHRGVQAIEMILVKCFGKFGVVTIPILAIIEFSYFLIKEVFEFSRFLKKDKLYKQGLVNNLEDDYIPVSFFQAIRNVLKPMKTTKEYPSEKFMRETLKKNKYFK